MEPKILFTDLDGTLLNTQKEITPANADAIDRALSCGHKIVINTGRPLTGCVGQIRALNLDREGCYAVTFNGGLIYDCHSREIIYKKTIPLPLARDILALTREKGIYCQTYDDHGILAMAETPELQYYTASTHVPYRLDPDLADHLAEEPVKLLAIDLKYGRNKLDIYREEMERLAGDKISLFYSSECYLEHVAAGISKGSAMQILCDRLNIPLSRTIAAGDEENDIPMILAAGTGAAMANASPAVKNCAAYVTQNDCDHSGVAEIIDRFMV